MVSAPSPYRDSSGKALTDYERPSLAVDTVVITLSPTDKLQVLLVKADEGAPNEWQLPGTFVHSGETLAIAVNRSLQAKAGLAELRPQQLGAFDALNRDPRGWVISIAHLVVVPVEELKFDPHNTRLTDLDTLPQLPYDHTQMVEDAVAKLRELYENSPDPAGLLGESFTIRELHNLHEIIAGTPLQRDTFRRSFHHKLTATGETVAKGRGKPAELFRALPRNSIR